VNLSKSVPVHTMNRTGGTAPVVPNLSTRWRSVVCFMPRPLYPQKKTPETVWLLCKRDKSCASGRNWTKNFQMSSP